MSMMGTRDTLPQSAQAPESLASLAPLAVRRFRAMNTDVEVRALDILSAPRLGRAEEIFASIERRFSRFLADSELSRLNGGTIRQISPSMFALLSLARRLHIDTHGMFDPSVMPALTAWGYARSFEQVRDDDREMAIIAPRHGTFRDVRLDGQSREVLLPEGMQIDVGGIGKGWAVDRAAELLLPDVGSFQINAGGDQYARGRCADGGGWPASVMHPGSGEAISVVRLNDQALATSSTAVRRWRRGRRVVHHLIDPRTGEPSDSGVTAASVIASSATEADVYAKCALLLGLEHGREFLMSRGCSGLFVLDDGSAAGTHDWPAPLAA